MFDDAKSTVGQIEAAERWKGDTEFRFSSSTAAANHEII